MKLSHIIVAAGGAILAATVSKPKDDSSKVLSRSNTNDSTIQFSPLILPNENSKTLPLNKLSQLQEAKTCPVNNSSSLTKELS